MTLLIVAAALLAGAAVAVKLVLMPAKHQSSEAELVASHEEEDADG